MKFLLKVAAVGAVVYGVILINRWAHERTLDVSDADDGSDDDSDNEDDNANDELAAAHSSAIDAGLVAESVDPVPVARKAPRRRNVR